jgi:tryptophan synthase alpha chain
MFPKKAFIPFTVLGDPDIETSKKIIKGLIESGANALELGFAFSDPIADGPVIQKANNRALAKGITTKKAFEIIEEIRNETKIPISIMLSYNLVYKYGTQNFYKKASELRIDAILCPDAPLEEAEELLANAKAHNINQVFLVSPTTTKERMQELNKVAKGYVYLVSLLGTTGTREQVNTKLPELIKSVKREMKLPVYVGFGISNPEQAKNVIRLGADGAISGSAFCKIIEEHLPNKTKMIEKITAFSKSMGEAVKNA